jgi:ectoine hydroxylase-related dioxygenase (phytanoyl-CoA dioxygenase family)
MTIHGSFANKSSNWPRLAFATHYVKDGTWIYRQDIQDTIEVQI